MATAPGICANSLWACLLFSVLCLILPGVRGACTPERVIVDVPSGYIALDGTLEVPSVFNLLPELPSTEPQPVYSTVNCSWLIWPAKASVESSYIRSVSLYVDLLVLQAGDRLRIYDRGNDSAALLYEVIGPSTVPPNTLSSSSGAPLYISYEGSSTSLKQFGAYFQAGFCLQGIQRLTRSDGFFTDGSGDDANYGLKSDCVFLIESSSETDLVTLKVLGTVEENYDFVYVYDGSTDTSPLVAILTGKLNMTIVSTGPALYIYFASDKTISLSGFKGEYSVHQGHCSGVQIFDDPAAVFSDESSLADYARDVSCDWLIQPSSKTVEQIILFFYDFQLAQGDYLTVYAATNGVANDVLAVLTGDNLPDPIEAYKSELLLSLTSNNKTTASGGGFTAVYHAGSCIGTAIIKSLQNTLTDGSGNASYASNLNCQWLVDLSSYSGVKNIKVSITLLDVEFKYDHLTIFDGNETSSPQLVNLSGYSLQDLTYYTSGPVMLLEFATDFSISGNGWELKYTAEYFVDTSSDDSYIIPVVVVVVVVGGLVLISLAIIAAFILWIRYKKKQIMQRELVEPNYSELVNQHTIHPVLLSMASSTAALPFITSPSKSILEQFKLLLLRPTFAVAFLVGAKASHIEVESSNLSKMLILNYAHHGQPLNLLKEYLRRELPLSSSKTLFREDTALTTMFKTYCKIEALPYLWHLFAQIIHDVQDTAKAQVQVTPEGDTYSSTTDVMMDPRKIFEEDDPHLNSMQLGLVAQKMLLAIFQSVNYFPRPLRKFFHTLRNRIRKRYPNKADKCYYQAASNFLFLRIFCPSLIDPYQYGLLEAPPDRATLRLLVMISKVLQGFANGVSFREEHMQNLNAFSEQNKESLHKYFDQIANNKVTRKTSFTQKKPSSPISYEPEKDEGSSSHTDGSVSMEELDIENGDILLADVPEQLRANKKAMKSTREKIVSILFAYAMALAPDITSSIKQVTSDKALQMKLEAQFKEVIAGVMDQIDVEEKYEEADVDTEQDDDDEEEEEDKGEERTEKQQSTDMYSINGGGSTWTQS